MAFPVAPDQKSIVHFLNRGGFGPTAGQIAQVQRRGLENYVRDQLDADPDLDVEKRVARFGDQGYTVTEMFEIYRGRSPLVKKGQPLNGIMPMLDNFYTAKIFRAAASESQLHEAGRFLVQSPQRQPGRRAVGNDRLRTRCHQTAHQGPFPGPARSQRHPPRDVVLPGQLPESKEPDGRRSSDPGH